MSRGVNKVILIGTAGKDPEVRYMPSGSAVANLSIATNEQWKDKETGEKKEKTEWHNLVFFGRLAEIVGEYIKKGAQIYVEGKLTTEKWQDKETGKDRYTTKVIASEMQMLGGRGAGGEHGSGESRPDTSGKPAASDGKTPAGNFDDFDDDIPF